jgi:hypothetical protein
MNGMEKWRDAESTSYHEDTKPGKHEKERLIFFVLDSDFGSWDWAPNQERRLRKKSKNASFCHSRENGNPGNSRSSGLPPSRE